MPQRTHSVAQAQEACLRARLALDATNAYVGLARLDYVPEDPISVRDRDGFPGADFQ